MHDREEKPGRPRDDPPRRAVIVFVASLAAAYVVVRTMMDTSRLQDCAASGRRDC